MTELQKWRTNKHRTSREGETWVTGARRASTERKEELLLVEEGRRDRNMGQKSIQYTSEISKDPKRVLPTLQFPNPTVETPQDMSVQSQPHTTPSDSQLSNTTQKPSTALNSDRLSTISPPSDPFFASQDQSEENEASSKADRDTGLLASPTRGPLLHENPTTRLEDKSVIPEEEDVVGRNVSPTNKKTNYQRMRKQPLHFKDFIMG